MTERLGGLLQLLVAQKLFQITKPVDLLSLFSMAKQLRRERDIETYIYMYMANAIYLCLVRER